METVLPGCVTIVIGPRGLSLTALTAPVRASGTEVPPSSTLWSANVYKPGTDWSMPDCVDTKTQSAVVPVRVDQMNRRLFALSLPRVGLNEESFGMPPGVIDHRSTSV